MSSRGNRKDLTLPVNVGIGIRICNDATKTDTTARSATTYTPVDNSETAAKCESISPGPQYSSTALELCSTAFEMVLFLCSANFFLSFFYIFFCTFLVKQNYSISIAKSEQATRQLQVINKSRFSHTRFAVVLQDLYSNCDMNSNPKKQSNRFLPLQTVHSTLCRPPDCSLVLSEAYAHVRTRTHTSGTTLVNAQHIAAGTSMGIWLAPMKCASKIHPGLVTKPLYQN